MSADSAVDIPIGSIVSAGIQIAVTIHEHIQKWSICKTTRSRIIKKLESLEESLKKVEKNVKGDQKEIEECVSHLERVREKCEDYEKTSTVMKILRSPSIFSDLSFMEEQLSFAMTKLTLFTATLTLDVARNTEDLAQTANEIGCEIVGKTKAAQKDGVTFIVADDVECPTAPYNLNIKVNKNAFKLSWSIDGGQDIDKYQIMYNCCEEATFYAKGEVVAVTIESPTVEHGKLYTMKIRAINKGGAGPWSSEVAAQLKNLPQKPIIDEIKVWSMLAKITVQKIDNVNATCGQSPITQWEIGYISSLERTWSTKYEPEDETCTFLIKNLKANMQYSFRIKAENANGWGEPSTVKSACTKNLPPIPPIPCIPSVSFCRASKAFITVNAHGHADSLDEPIIAWEICYYADDTKYIKLYEPELSERSSTIALDNLTGCKKYVFLVRLLNEAGWSELSDMVIKHNVIPSEPTNLRVSGKRTDSIIKIRWNPPDIGSTIITHYEINKGDKNQMEEIYSVPAKYLSATFVNLKHKKDYFFRIRSVNDTLVSDWTLILEVKTRLHKGIKAVFSPIVWTVGTVTAPLATAVGMGAMAGDKVKGDEPKVNTAAVAAGTAGAAGGLLVGTVAAPVVGAVWAHVFMHGIDKLDLSDQSDDENDEDSHMKYFGYNQK